MAPTRQELILQFMLALASNSVVIRDAKDVYQGACILADQYLSEAL
jgi:hypothetical protein